MQSLSYKGNEYLRRMLGVSVDINGVTLDIKYGDPLANSPASAAGWDDLIDLDDSFSTAIVGWHYLVYLGDTPPDNLNDKCLVSYKQVADATSLSKIRLNTC